MWKWTCPASPKISFEYHSAAGAREGLEIHALRGFPERGITPCTLVHEIVDDGVPCGEDDCKIPYTREWGISSGERWN